MRFHIKRLSYHHYACNMPTMLVLCLFITTIIMSILGSSVVLYFLLLCYVNELSLG